MKTNTQARVVRVTRTEFELSDGRVYEHPVPLDYTLYHRKLPANLRFLEEKRKASEVAK